MRHKKFQIAEGIALYTPTSDDVALAHQRSCDMGVLPGSYLRGMGRMTGCLGEITVNKFLPRSKYVGADVFTHDILFKKKRIEVKSKSCGGMPKPQYAAFVNCKQGITPDNDHYIFTRVRRDLSKVYLVGWLATLELLSKAEFVKKGDSDESGFVFKSSGYHVPISDLNKIEEFRSSC